MAKSVNNPSDPGSWNRYAYTRDDPVNRLDAAGTCDTSTDSAYSVTVCGGDPDPVAPSDGGDVGPTYQGVHGVPIPAVAGFLSNMQAVAAAVNATFLAIGVAVEAAENALANNPNCAGLFSLDSNAPTPIALLAQIASGNDPQAYFTEEFLNPLIPNTSVNAVTQVTSYSMQNGALVNTGVANNAVVAFNYYPGTFNGAGVTANAITVLHELGHVYELLYGLGSTLLVNDSISVQGNQAAAASAFNTQLVKTNCFPGGR
jgi:hypothetical protein